MSGTSAKGSRLSTGLFYGIAAAVSLVVGLYISAFMSLAAGYWSGDASAFPRSSLGLLSYAGALPLAAFVFALLYSADRFRKIPRWLIRHRFALSGAVLVICCVLGVSGSSIGIWPQYLGDDGIRNTLFGIPRGIRSDEWAVNTPFIFSQVETGAQEVSPVIRGGNTSVTLSPALPAWTFSVLFRIPYWGYLVLGEAGGLAFAWVGRLLALALATFELTRLITKGDDGLSACAALLVTFAPVVQWWSASVLLILGQCLVLCLNAMICADRRWKRWLLALLLSYLLCCYALELYPAWQVPLFYVFAAAGVYVCYQAKVDRGVSWRALIGPIILPFLAAAVVCIGVVAFCLWSARDVVAITSATVYPGQRSESGGDRLSAITSYLGNCAIMPVAPFTAEAIAPNVCEASVAIALFPIGFVLAVVKMVRHRDARPLFLLIPYVFFSLYAVIGFPSVLARFTLMSNVPVTRLAYPLGYLDIMLVVYACAMGADGTGGRVREYRQMGLGVRVLIAAVVAVAYAAIMAARAFFLLLEGFSAVIYLFVGAFFAIGAFVVLLPEDAVRAHDRSRGQFLALWTVLVVCAGLCVNPVQLGVAELMEDDVVKMVDKVEQSDPDGMWVGDSSIIAQSCLVTGAKTLNSVNSYPNLDLWHRIDPDGENEDVYNRYAHILVEMTDADEGSFQLLVPDTFLVTLTGEDVVDLGIDYWLSAHDLTAYDSETVAFEPLAEADGLTVYHVKRL